MDKVKLRVLIITALVSLLAFTPRAAQAQTPLEPTQIVVGAPAEPNLGEQITVQAVLADSQGHPISKAVIYFTTETTFLGKRSDVVLAQAVTNGNGQAVAQFTNNFSGNFTLQAEFRGDSQYAPSSASTETVVTGDAQVYTEHVGVDIPGLNVPPAIAPMASIESPRGITGFIQNLWPAMNGWPMAAVLLLVWSMYLVAVRFVFRIATLGSKPEEPPFFESRGVS